MYYSTVVYVKHKWIGRTVVFALSALWLYLGNRWLPFLLFAGIAIALPFIIQRRLGAQKQQLTTTN